tara:strand:+ start:5666 stop:5968 length:303 start_codon:yes stop_codon:yes gene_type:complete
MGLRWQRHGTAIYRTPQWKAVRTEAKRRDGWKCIKCGSRTRLEVDHIKGLRDGGDPFNLENLQTLCGSCHAKKTRIEIGLGELDPEKQKWATLLRMGLTR